MIKSVSFTGHRYIPGDVYLPLYRRLSDKIEELAKAGCTVFNTGGALGFDTMAAQAVLKVKQRYPRVQLHLYLPCPQQAENWPASRQAVYSRILNRADKVIYSSRQYYPFSMNMRNRALVDNADLCIAFCQRPTGGTAYTLGYAMDSGLPFVNLAEKL